MPKGNELPRNGPSCLCEIFLFFFDLWHIYQYKCTVKSWSPICNRYWFKNTQIRQRRFLSSIGVQVLKCFIFQKLITLIKRLWTTCKRLVMQSTTRQSCLDVSRQLICLFIYLFYYEIVHKSIKIKGKSKILSIQRPNDISFWPVEQWRKLNTKYKNTHKIEIIQ